MDEYERMVERAAQALAGKWWDVPDEDGVLRDAYRAQATDAFEAAGVPDIYDERNQAQSRLTLIRRLL